jgi:hypothetical protein
MCFSRTYKNPAILNTKNYQYRQTDTHSQFPFRNFSLASEGINPTHHSCQGTCKSGIVQAKTLNLVVIDKGKG